MPANSGARKRSIKAEIRRAKIDVLRYVTQEAAVAAIQDHRDGHHLDPDLEKYRCYACLAWTRRRTARGIT